jgi:hypothetical protein
MILVILAIVAFFGLIFLMYEIKDAPIIDDDEV